MNHTYSFAGHAVEITTQYALTQKMCEEYRTESAPEFAICTSTGDIDFERRKSAEEDALEGMPVRTYADDYLETLAVYRKLAEKLIRYNILLLHGSVIAVDHEAYLFTAKSGTGKSTHVRLWQQLFGERATVINDDKPLLSIQDEKVTVFGTPWDGKHHLSTNTSCNLKAICVLERGTENYITTLKSTDVFPILVQQCYRPHDKEKMLQTFSLLDELCRSVSFYELHCNMEPEAAQVAYDGMNQA